jgi:hypothetical protein
MSSNGAKVKTPAAQSESHTSPQDSSSQDIDVDARQDPPASHSSNDLEQSTRGDRDSAIRPSTVKNEDISTQKAHTSNSVDPEKSRIPATEIQEFDNEDHEHYTRPAETARDLVTEVIHVRDDPTLNPLTFRTWFLGITSIRSSIPCEYWFIKGIGLSVFGGILATVYYFKPQTVTISTIFLAVISYVLGELLSLIPRRTAIGRLFNPHPVSLGQSGLSYLLTTCSSIVKNMQQS